MSNSKLRHQKGKNKAAKDKIKIKIKKIRTSGNEVFWTDSYIKNVMEKYNIENYTVAHWGGITVTTNLSEWRVENDGVVVTLKHSSKDVLSFQNDRGSYHLQNVFYDLDFCIKSIVSHEEYERSVRYGIHKGRG